MSEHFTYNGDHLLELFKDLDIDLGGLDPNVVRAWFDTDDQNVKNLLHFMCSGLSTENIVTAQEITEFESLEDPLYGAQLENAFLQIEKENPNILKIKLNSKLLDTSLKEFDLLIEEERKLDKLLEMEERLQKKLLQDKLKLERESVEIDFKYEEASKMCMQMSELVDEKNQCLHEKLSRGLIALANFQCNEFSDFFNTRNLDDLIESVEFHENLEELLKQQRNELSGYFSLSKVNLNSTPNDENSEDKLTIMQNQISRSYLESIRWQMEAESLAEIQNFLENYFIQDYLMNDNLNCFSDGERQKSILWAKLEKKALSVSEEPIVLIKTKRSQAELSGVEHNYQCFSQISKYYSKLLNTVMCAFLFLHQEKNVIEEVDQGIRHISKYILYNLEDTKDRIEVMSNTIEDYNEYCQKPLEQRSKVLNVMVDIYGESNLKNAYSSCHQVEKNLKMLERKIFENLDMMKIVEKLYNNEAIEQFLTSCYTKKFTVIPTPILKSLINIRNTLTKQESATKFLLQTSVQTTKTLNADKCQKNLRLAWMYFLIAPKKFKDFISQIEEEFKKKEVKSVRFKEVPSS